MATQPQPIPQRLPKPERDFFRFKKKYGIYEGSELGPLLEEMAGIDEIVAGFLPARAVSILVGDSGIGKSPLAYQLGMAAAVGAPFLGMACRPSKVMYVDFENSPAAAHTIMEQQYRHLGLSQYPCTFQLWPMHLQVDPPNVEDVISMFAPDLVIIDSLRSFNPTMESDNSKAVEQVARMRSIAAERGVSFLLIHHLHKRRRALHSLEDGSVMDWLTAAAGARAVINQTDVRLGVEARKDGLLLRGHYRTRGEIGPVVMRRILEKDGRPRAYERVELHAGMMQNSHQEAAFLRLSGTFSFAEAGVALGQSRQSTSLFLKKGIQLGLISKTGVSRYFKNLQVSPAESSASEVDTLVDSLL